MSFTVEELAQFAAGITSLDQFRERVVSVLLDDDPSVGDDCASATLSIMCEWATYLEMACDADDPGFDESEARRLAGAMCAILIQVPENDGRFLVSPMARWAPATVEKIRKYQAGTLSRDAFERFVARRPWPDEHKRVVRALYGYQLLLLADALELNDYRAVIAILES